LGNFSIEINIIPSNFETAQVEINGSHMIYLTKKKRNLTLFLSFHANSHKSLVERTNAMKSSIPGK